MNFRPDFDRHRELPVRGRGNPSVVGESAMSSRPRHDHVTASPRPDQLAALAAKIHGARSRRFAILGSDVIGESGWEMLVALYRSEAQGHRTTISNLCLASHAPQSTALRWIEKLVELGMVHRRKNPLDSRVIFIELNPSTRQAVYDYLSDVWTTLYSNELERVNPQR